MPQRKTANGEYKDICFPITADARAEIQSAILKAYYEKTDNNAVENQSDFNSYSSNCLQKFTENCKNFQKIY